MSVSSLLAQDNALAPVELPPPSGEIIADDTAYLTPADGDSSASMFSGMSSWVLPSGWFLPSVWERGLELGINGSEGNAQALSVLAAGRVKRETDRSVMKTEIVYGKTQANSVVTQHYGFLESRWDWKFGESRWSYFNVFRAAFDEFKAFDYRLNLTSGLGYHFIDSETTELAGRFGAGASREFGGGDETWKPEADFGVDYEHQVSKRQKLAATVDYYPAWEDFSDYRLVSNVSWELILDEATNLSLKVGAINRYDSTPFGREPSDIDYFLTLLWKI